MIIDVANICKFGLFGSLLFTLIIIIVSQTGLFDAVRDPEGKFRKKLTWKSGLAFGLMLSFMFLLFYLGNQSLAAKSNVAPGLLDFWLNGFCIFMIVHLYDLIILDYLIVVKWHPAFLKMPDTDYYNTFKPHFQGFLRGIPFGLVVTLLVALIS